MPERERMAPARARLTARVMEMSAEEVAGRVGAERSRGRADLDGDEMYVELVAAHEGFSSGRLSGGRGPGTPARKYWARERIAELVERLGRGVPVYVSHEGRRGPRRPAGEVVSAAERWIGGALHAVGIARIGDPAVKARVRSGELDACSIEAEIECHRESGRGAGPWIVDAVRSVSGVALGDSRRERPGFAGAGVVPALALEFAEGGAPEDGAPPDPGIDALAARAEELEKRLAAQERRLAELGEELSRRRDDESARGIAAPPERRRSGPSNPLIPR